jgi:hypothetical protein
MLQNGPAHPLSETRKQQIFLALIEAQDQDLGVSRSRKLIAENFRISEDQVIRIEREGIENNWPPL